MHNIPGSWLTSISGFAINSSPFLVQVRLRFSVSLSAVSCCISLPRQGSRTTPPEHLLPIETGSALTASSKNDDKIVTDRNNKNYAILFLFSIPPIKYCIGSYRTLLYIKNFCSFVAADLSMKIIIMEFYTIEFRMF